MAHRFHTLDVFTDVPLAGNPLAVVHDADDLDVDAMQAIAREFNLSETVFLLKPDISLHTARIRIFTPGRELPFAGHPTVGAAVLLAGLRWPDNGGQEGIIVLEEQIGPVRVGVRPAERSGFAEFDAPQTPERVDPAPDLELAAAGLGLLPSEVGFENHRVSRWSAGVELAFVPVRNLDIMRRCRPDGRIIDQALGGSVYAYCRETFSQDNDFHARMFAPSLGISEDPATGAAAAAFAGVVMEFDQPTGGHHRYRIEQGHIMGRPSLIELEIGVQGKLDGVRIGGSAVVVAEGELRL